MVCFLWVFLCVFFCTKAVELCLEHKEMGKRGFFFSQLAAVVYKMYFLVWDFFLLSESMCGAVHLFVWCVMEENREKWRKLVAKSSVVPQRPSRLRD